MSDHRPLIHRCPHCGFRLQLHADEVGLPIQCKCGKRVTANTTQANLTPGCSQAQIDQRTAVCRGCQYHNNQRCTKIELGCRPAYLRHLNDPATKCPLDKWDKFPGYGTPVTTRHLIYHIYASKWNDLWLDNLDVLNCYINPAFNGKRIAAISSDNSTHPFEKVAQVASQLGFECHEHKNDPVIREVATFLPLLESVYSLDPSEAIFYGHTKGNTTSDSKRGAKIWRNIGYRSLVGEWEKCIKHLETYPCVGMHKICWPAGTTPPYPSKLMHGNWMSAGTYFWFRSAAVYSLPNWNYVPQDRYGAEAWLSGLFPDHKSCKSVYQLWPEDQYPTPSPYGLITYPEQDQKWEPPVSHSLTLP